MSLKVTGTVTKILPQEKGTSKDGKEWVKQQFILDNNDTYNNIFCFEVFGAEKVENFLKFNKVGSVIDVDFNVSTNEWKDKYYTSLSVWKTFKAEASAIEKAAKVIDAVFEPAGDLNEDDHDDLPF